MSAALFRRWRAGDGTPVIAFWASPVSDHPTVRAFTTGVLVLAVTWAFFATPLLRFADAGMLALCGALLGAGAAGAWIAAGMGWGRRWEWPAIAAAIVGVICTGWQLNVASSHYEANLKRCAAIERDMLAASPRRADGPAIFEALHASPRAASNSNSP
jgi:hypothetical protein